MKMIGRKTAASVMVVEMTAKGFGCVGITGADGKLMGIITDGDLRRHMRPDLLAAKVDVLTALGETGSATVLASATRTDVYRHAITVARPARRRGMYSGAEKTAWS